MRKGIILPNRLVVVPEEKKETVKGSIIVPNQVIKNETLSGRVLLAGAACDTIEEDMIVMYPKLAATKFNFDDEPDKDYFLLPESSVVFAYWPE